MVSKARMLFTIVLLAAPALIAKLSCAQQKSSAVDPASPRVHPKLVLVSQHQDPVITVQSPGAEDNKYGFEDGRVVKIGDRYHLITTEMFTEPFSVKTRIGYWTSGDRVRWTRVSTLMVSSGDQTGKDPRASLWGPMPIWNQESDSWELFYVAYRSQPQTEPRWLLGYEGRIWRAISQTKGVTGIGGPYKDVGIVLEPGPLSEAWEGLQGTDSFFPYQVGKRWYGIYGTAHTEKLPVTAWQLGLASAPDLAGPWKRYAGVNPLRIEPVFAENPIVTQLDDGTFMAVYDSDNDKNAIGYSWSADGVHWAPGVTLIIQPVAGQWASEVTTPLGLIPEGKSEFTVFYTGRIRPTLIYSESIGFVTLKLVPATKPSEDLPHGSHLLGPEIPMDTKRCCVLNIATAFKLPVALRRWKCSMLLPHLGYRRRSRQTIEVLLLSFGLACTLLFAIDRDDLAKRSPGKFTRWFPSKTRRRKKARAVATTGEPKATPGSGCRRTSPRRCSRLRDQEKSVVSG